MPADTTNPRTRILVVANETAASKTLCTAVAPELEGETAEILLLAPALNSRLRHWLSDDDDARRAARRRVQLSLRRLADCGIRAEGVIGDADPMQAIEDSLAVFPADRMIVATHPDGRSNWLARDLVGRASERFGLPITHIVVDEGAEGVYTVRPVRVPRPAPSLAA